jgi:dTDP-4-amino-4,6-dideoxygalactose transaminase
MTTKGPRILLIGGTYRALCLLERLLERGECVAAFIGQEGSSERDFCPEILEICDRASIPARSGRKLGEEMVRWLEDRIRPELTLAVGVTTEIPLAIGGNSRLGLVEVIDRLQVDSCPGVVLRQRGQEVIVRELGKLSGDEDPADLELETVELMLDAVDHYLDRFVTRATLREDRVTFDPEPIRSQAIAAWVARPDPACETEQLEEYASRYLEAENVLALRDPADGFDLLARALELGPEHEVICPGIVSRAAIEGLGRSGVRPVFVDVDPQCSTLDPAAAEEAITARTRALLIAHPFGQPARLDELYGLAEERGLEVIEDGSSSLGARFGASRIGRSPCACVFAFGRSGADRAALLTVPDTLSGRVRERGAELRLGAGGAAAMLERLDSWEQRLSSRRRNAACYSAELSRYDAFTVPPTPEDAPPVYAQYVLRVTRFARTSAEDLHKLLGEVGVETRRIGVPLAERDLVRLPATEQLRATSLLLPVEQGLGEPELDRVLEAIFDYAIG